MSPVSYYPRGAFIRRELYVGDMVIHAGQIGANHYPGMLHSWSVWWGIVGGPMGVCPAVTDDFGSLVGVA